MKFRNIIVFMLLISLFWSQTPAGATALLETIEGKNEAVAPAVSQNQSLDGVNGSRDLKHERRKKYWEQEKATAQSMMIVGLVLGSAGLIGGSVLYYDGEYQRSHAGFVQKGNYLTNEDDVNSGNEKVLGGGLILLGAAGLLALGAVQGARLGPLEREGLRRGFILSLEPHQGVSLQYAWNF